ncbi:MAG: DNA/RNA nuclease SfsA [Oscillatoriaceae bacterium SKW80]|nr:DNA/RNA nuclease SfsA [Oscillatoriaceae bacterium SKYG93]MCX8122059.1 DNA/RNA nuclease SfsA [Oscillatoriaceae bacterium SKW80]MDW8454346.1 DNA/RNA nuclease SfsA [Oscillatoriaceae cyanobacterium SKYGB_i_bin93]HIK29211.1 DNA/RNA nuclease SfsA [Oscillatoriaceae cyanobacterium M7585_C2015_266]
MELIYKYPTLYPGILIKRYKRFLADIKLDTGEQITAHCPNPGQMRGLSAPGSRVLVSRSQNVKRKLRYSLELVAVQNSEKTWVGVNTNLPNQVIKLALQQRIFPELGEYEQIISEVTYGQNQKSRVDFLLSRSQGKSPIYLEVKNVTWAEGKTALFPDAVTVRGQQHLLDMMAVVRKGARAVTLFFISRSDCDQFVPGDNADPVYGKLLRSAVKQGVEILPCRFEMTPLGIRYLGLANLQI